MRSLDFLMSKGVSKAGAAQVVLGQPITRFADRTILQNLALPIAMKSLSKPSGAQPLTPSPISGIRGLAKAPAFKQATSGRQLTTDPVWLGASNLEYLMGLVAKLSVEQTQATQSQIADLRSQIKVKDSQLKALLSRLDSWLCHPPNPAGGPAPIAVWISQLEMLRRRIEELQAELRLLERELAELMGQV